MIISIIWNYIHQFIWIIWNWSINIRRRRDELTIFFQYFIENLIDIKIYSNPISWAKRIDNHPQNNSLDIRDLINKYSYKLYKYFNYGLNMFEFFFLKYWYIFQILMIPTIIIYVIWISRPHMIHIFIELISFLISWIFNLLPYPNLYEYIDKS